MMTKNRTKYCSRRKTKRNGRNEHDVIFKFDCRLNTTNQWIQLKKKWMTLRWTSAFRFRILFAETSRLLLNLIRKRKMSFVFVIISIQKTFLLYLYLLLQLLSKRSVRHSSLKTPKLDMHVPRLSSYWFFKNKSSFSFSLSYFSKVEFRLKAKIHSPLTNNFIV